MLTANRSHVSVEDLVRTQHPELYKTWDGSEIRLSVIENRTDPETKKKCSVTLVTSDNKTHATFDVNTETDAVNLIWGTP